MIKEIRLDLFLNHHFLKEKIVLQVESVTV